MAFAARISSENASRKKLVSPILQQWEKSDTSPRLITPIQGGSHMVGGSMLNLTGGAHEKRRPRCLGMDRRLRFWMGSTYTVRKDGCRSLDGGGKRTPRKPDGDSSSVEPSDVGNLGRLQTCPGVHRQRYSVVRYQQKWLYEVQGSNQKSGKLRDLHKTTRIHVSMLRIPGDQNGFADSLSRGEVMPVEWEVTPHDWNCIQSWT